MPNKTDIDPLWWPNVFGASSYSILGLSTAIGNLLIAASIGRYAALRRRKEHIILMCLSFFDSLHQMANVCAGMYRLNILLINPNSPRLTQAECLLRPHVVAWVVAPKLSAQMLVLVSVDRLLLVALRQVYIARFGARYAWAMVAACLVVCLAFFAPTLALSLLYPKHETVNPICYVPESLESDTAWNSYFVFAEKNAVFWFALISVVLFAAVPCFYVRNRNSVAAATEASSVQLQMKRQKQLTKTMALSAACTLFLYCLPTKLGYVFWYEGMYWVSWCCFVLATTNPMANIVLYHLRQHEIRTAVESMIKRKHMPQNLDMWPKKTSVRRN